MKVNIHIQKLDYPEYANSSHSDSKVNLAQQRGREEQVGYALTQDRELIRKIARMENVGEENILITAGADAALHHVAETFLDGGKRSLIPLPTFGRLEFHTKVVGAKAIFVNHTKFPHSFDLEKITSVAKEKKADVIFLSNPNNPTGELINREKLKKFVKANKHALIVIDEVLIEDLSNSFGAFVNRYKNVIVVKSFSKLFETPGLRVGYILANPRVMRLIEKTVSPYEVSSLSLFSVRRIVSEKHILDRKKKILHELRALLKEKLGLPLTNTEATVCLIDGGRSKVSLFDYLHQHGILTVEGKNFRGLGKSNTVRIVITNKKDVRQLIKIVNQYIGN